MHLPHSATIGGVERYMFACMYYGSMYILTLLNTVHVHGKRAALAGRTQAPVLAVQLPYPCPGHTARSTDKAMHGTGMARGRSLGAYLGTCKAMLLKLAPWHGYCVLVVDDEALACALRAGHSPHLRPKFRLLDNYSSHTEKKHLNAIGIRAAAGSGP